MERSIDRPELLLGEEAFLAGTGVEIVPMTRLDHRPIGTGQPGEVTTAIRRLYFEAVRGRLPSYRSWCEPVLGRTAASVAKAT